MNEVVVIRGALNATDALCVVASLTEDFDAHIESEVVYPYFCFEAACSIATLAGRRQLTLLCLVDAINGVGATADEFHLGSEPVGTGRVLDSELDDAAAASIAHKTVSHRLGRKLRTITTFDIELTARGMVHKRFWIVRSSNARIMVDSTNGSLHPLKLKAA